MFCYCQYEQRYSHTFARSTLLDTIWDLTPSWFSWTSTALRARRSLPQSCILPSSSLFGTMRLIHLAVEEQTFFRTCIISHYTCRTHCTWLKWPCQGLPVTANLFPRGPPACTDCLVHFCLNLIRLNVLSVQHRYALGGPRGVSGPTDYDQIKFVKSGPTS